MKKISVYIQYAIVIVAFAVCIGLAMFHATDNPQYELILKDQNLLLDAFFSTIYISLVSLIGTLIVGFFLFMMMRSKIVILRAISNVFNEIIMGTPLLVMIFLIVYVLGVVIHVDDKLLLGIFALILYNAPYVANAYDTTAAVVDEDQYVLMDLYQFKWYQKYIYVIIPQMIKPFIPSLINNLSSVIKSSSLLKIIAISEITYITESIAARNFAFIEGYFVMWMMYLVVTIPLSLLAKYIGKKVSA